MFLSAQTFLVSVVVVGVEVLQEVVVVTWDEVVFLSEVEVTVVDTEEAIVDVDLPHTSTLIWEHQGS